MDLKKSLAETVKDYRENIQFNKCIDNAFKEVLNKEREEKDYKIAIIGIEYGDLDLLLELGLVTIITEESNALDNILIATTKEEPIKLCQKFIDKYIEDNINKGLSGFSEKRISTDEGEGYVISGPTCASIMSSPIDIIYNLDLNREKRNYISLFNVDKIITFVCC